MNHFNKVRLGSIEVLFKYDIKPFKAKKGKISRKTKRRCKRIASQLRRQAIKLQTLKDYQDYQHTGETNAIHSRRARST